MKAHEITNKEELIKALRCGGHNMMFHYCDKEDCPYCQYSYHDNLYRCNVQELGTDASDALEASEKRIADLEAEVERLKASNEELRERQTYIDHWGNKWITSGKDVPTEAYNHGFLDGEQACNCGAKMHTPCEYCQEFDCYGCEYKNGAER